MRYKKKPEFIEAEKLTEDLIDGWILLYNLRGIPNSKNCNTRKECEKKKKELLKWAKENDESLTDVRMYPVVQNGTYNLIVDENDYIVIDRFGHKQAIAKDTFESAWEPVDQEGVAKS